MMLFDILLEESITENIEIPSDWEKMSDSDFFSMSDSVLVKRSIPGARFENAGSSRSVWVVGNRVLKLAMNQFGVKQNREEVKIGRAGYKHFTRVFEFDSKFRWLVCELAEPILGREFKEYFGVGIDELGISLRYLQAGSSATEPLDGSKPSLRKLLRPIVARQLQSGDSTKLSSWGKVFRNGKMVPVILDYGFAGFHYYDDLPGSIGSGLSPGNKRFYKGRPKDLLAKCPLQLRRIKENYSSINMIDEYTGWMRKDGKFFPLGNFATHDDYAEYDGSSSDDYYRSGFIRISSFSENGKREIWGGSDFRRLNSRDIKNLIDLAIEGGFDSVTVLPEERVVWTKKDDLNEALNPHSADFSLYGWMDKKGKFTKIVNGETHAELSWRVFKLSTIHMYAHGYIRIVTLNDHGKKVVSGTGGLGGVPRSTVKHLIDFAIENGADEVWTDTEGVVWTKDTRGLGESTVYGWHKAWMSPKAEIFPLEYSETHEEWIKEYYGDYEKAMRFGWSRLVIGDYGSELIIENKLKTLNRNQMDELMVLAVKKNVKRVYYDGPSGFNIIWKEDFGRDSFSRAVGECIGESVPSNTHWQKAWMSPKGEIIPLLQGDDHTEWMLEYLPEYNDFAKTPMKMGWTRLLLVNSDGQWEMLVENSFKQISRIQIQEIMVIAAKRGVVRIFYDGPNGYDTFWEAEDAPGWTD